MIGGSQVDEEVRVYTEQMLTAMMPCRRNLCQAGWGVNKMTATAQDAYQERLNRILDAVVH